MYVEIECNEDLQKGTLELKLVDFDKEDWETLDRDTFFNAVFDNLNEDYQTNGTRYEYLFIDTFNNVYNGTFCTNTCFWNAIFDLYETGRALLHALDPEDSEEVRAEWFN